VDDGFTNLEKIQELLDNSKISAANKEAIRAVLTQVRRAVEAAEAEAAKAQAEAEAEEATDESELVNEEEAN
jgi:BRCT domain type II-containing protein